MGTQGLNSRCDLPFARRKHLNNLTNLTDRRLENSTSQNRWRDLGHRPERRRPIPRRNNLRRPHQRLGSQHPLPLQPTRKTPRVRDKRQFRHERCPVL